MLDPSLGPFLFDTSAEGWFKRNESAATREWLTTYLHKHPPHLSSITVFERIRGYALLRRSKPERKAEIDRAKIEYLRNVGNVWPVDTGIAAIAAEICALIPAPPSPPKRAHRIVGSRQERLARWRNDTMIAATALASDLLLIHNNAADFEAIRGGIEREPTRFPDLGPLKLMRCDSVLKFGAPTGAAFFYFPPG